MSGYVLCFLLYFPYSTIVQKFGRVGNGKRARCLSEPFCYITNQITKKPILCKNEQITYENKITAAKVRGFGADSKK